MPKNEFESILEKFNPTKPYLEDPNKLVFSDDKDFKPLPKQEYEELLESIRLNGVLHTIYVRRDFSIISGRNRTTACLELGRLTPIIRFRKDLPIDVEQTIKYHLNFVGRQISPAEKKKMVFARFKDQIGKRGALQAIHKITGIHISTLKQYSVAVRNEKSFEKGELSEKKIREGARLYLQWEKLHNIETKAQNERRAIQRELEKLAPLSYWKNKKWEKS